MEVFELIIFLFFIIMSYLALISDIEKRKVSNKINFLFILVSFFLFFILNILNFDLVSILFVLMSALLAFFLFSKKIWGAADGKFFIGINLLLIGLYSYIIFFEFLLNLVVLYSLGIIALVLFKTTLKQKTYQLRNMEYSLFIFQTLFVLALGGLFFKFLDVSLDFVMILASFGFFIFLILILSNPLKKLYRKIDENEKILINFILFCVGFFFLLDVFIYSFILIFFMKVLIKFVSEQSDKIKTKSEETFSSPFIIYLVLAGIISFILQTNILTILVQLFFR